MYKQIDDPVAYGLDLKVLRIKNQFIMEDKIYALFGCGQIWI